MTVEEGVQLILTEGLDVVGVKIIPMRDFSSVEEWQHVLEMAQQRKPELAIEMADDQKFNQAMQRVMDWTIQHQLQQIRDQQVPN